MLLKNIKIVFLLTVGVDPGCRENQVVQQLD